MRDLKWDRTFANEQAGEDPELLAELVGLLQESSQSDLRKIKDGLATGDASAVADAAHSIKGAAASLGFEGLREESYTIEKQGRANQLAAVDLTVLSELVDALSALTL